MAVSVPQRLLGYLDGSVAVGNQHVGPILQLVPASAMEISKMSCVALRCVLSAQRSCIAGLSHGEQKHSTAHNTAQHTAHSTTLDRRSTQHNTHSTRTTYVKWPCELNVKGTCKYCFAASSRSESLSPNSSEMLLTSESACCEKLL